MRSQGIQQARRYFWQHVLREGLLLGRQHAAKCLQWSEEIIVHCLGTK